VPLDQGQARAAAGRPDAGRRGRLWPDRQGQRPRRLRLPWRQLHRRRGREGQPSPRPRNRRAADARGRPSTNR